MSSSRQEIYLVGHHKHQITGSKLPSNGDCLWVLFVGFNLDISANLVIEECNIFWKKARIPTQEPHKCKLKLKKLYEIWQNLPKSIYKTSEVLINKHLEFSSSMYDLFDISHQNALIIMTIEEDKQFLIKQLTEEYNSENESVQEQETNILNPSKIARKQLLIPRLASALDKCKTSERHGIHLIMAFMEAVSLDPSTYVINRTSIRNQRNIFRKIYIY